MATENKSGKSSLKSRLRNTVSRLAGLLPRCKYLPWVLVGTAAVIGISGGYYYQYTLLQEAKQQATTLTQQLETTKSQLTTAEQCATQATAQARAAKQHAAQAISRAEAAEMMAEQAEHCAAGSAQELAAALAEQEQLTELIYMFRERNNTLQNTVRAYQLRAQQANTRATQAEQRLQLISAKLDTLNQEKQAAQRQAEAATAAAAEAESRAAAAERKLLELQRQEEITVPTPS